MGCQCRPPVVPSQNLQIRRMTGKLVSNHTHCPGREKLRPHLGPEDSLWERELEQRGVDIGTSLLHGNMGRVQTVAVLVEGWCVWSTFQRW